MPVVDVLNGNAEIVSTVELSESVFEVPVKKAVLHEVVKMQMATRRTGSAAVKRRSDVRGSTRKLFRQKGTGRARRGDIKAPLLRGGGVVFGPAPKSWAYSMPKKKKQLALKMALSAKLQDNELKIVNSFGLSRPRTKDFVASLKKLKLKNALVVFDACDDALDLSSRNVPGVKMLSCKGLNVYDILKYEHLVILQEALTALEGRFHHE